MNPTTNNIEEVKEQLKKDFAYAMADEIESGKLTPEDAQKIAQELLIEIAKINSQEEVLNLVKLNKDKYNYFSGVYVKYTKDTKSEEEKKVIEKISNLIKNY